MKKGESRKAEGRKHLEKQKKCTFVVLKQTLDFMTETATIYTQYPGYYNYNVMNMGYFVVEKPVIYESYYYEQNEVLYCTTATEKGVYCLNNPLKYTDPTGEFIWIPMLIGAAISAAFYTVQVANSPGGFQNFNPGHFVLSVGIGAFSGIAGAGVGAIVGGVLTSAGISGFVGSAITGAASGLVTGTVGGIGMAAMTGDRNAIWKGGLMGMGTGILTGGIIGGTDALEDGRRFWIGDGKFDLSKGYAASGNFEIGKETITGRYVGKFEDVNVFESKMLGDYNTGSYSGVTIPERGIIVGKGVYRNNFDFMAHEFGHILQYRKYGASVMS